MIANDKAIDAFLDAVVPAFTAMDLDTFADTVNYSEYDPLFARSWHAWILDLISACESSLFPAARTAALFPNPSEIRCKLFFDLWTADAAGATRTERMRIFSFYHSLLEALCLEDPFGAAKNIIHGERELRAIASSLVDGSPAAARRLGRLVSALYHFGHAAFSDMAPSVVYDNFGPYPAPGGEPGTILAVKEFANLDAGRCWKEVAPLPFSRVTITCVYTNVSMRVDAASHALYEGDLIGGLRQLAFTVDGQPAEAAAAPALAAAVEAQAEEIFAKFKALSFEERKAKYIYQRSEPYVRLCSALGISTEPPLAMFEEARGKALFRPGWPKDPAEQQVFVRKRIDPRR